MALGSGDPRTPSTVLDAKVDATIAVPMRAVPSAVSVRAVLVGRPCLFELRAADAYGNACEHTPGMVNVSAMSAVPSACELTPGMVDVSATSAGPSAGLSAGPSAEEMEVVVVTDEPPPPLDHPGRLRVRVRVTVLATTLATRRYTLVARCAGLEASVGVEGVSLNAAVPDAPMGSIPN